MPIKSISLNNFKSINELTIDIDKNTQVICFVGENGSSKTSLLSLIVDSIIPNLRLSFPDYNPDEKKRFRSISQMEVGENKNHYSLAIDYLSEEKIISYKRDVFNVTKTNENKNQIENDKWNKIPLNNFFTETNSPTQDKSTNYLLNNIFLFRPSYRYEPDALEVNKEKENFIFQVSTQKSNVTDYPFTFKVAHSGNDLESLIIELFLDNHIGYEDSVSAFSGIPRILNIITNKDYGNFQISRHPYRKLWSSTKGLITSLSQGELDLLVTITSIITRQLYIYNESPNLKEKYKNFTEVPGLVVIDEVDLHLHPKAQENYLKVLTSNFKNIQFLVTTHSPFVVRGLPQESIVIQLPSGNLINENFSLMDIDSITNTIFNYDGRFTDIVEKDLKMFKKMISQITEQDNNLQSLSIIYQKYKLSPQIINELHTYLSIFSSPEFTKRITGE